MKTAYKSIMTITLVSLLVFCGSISVSSAQDAPEVEWSQTYGGGANDGGDSVEQTSDGGYIIAGYTMSYGGHLDVWLVKTDAEGNKEWERNFGTIVLRWGEPVAANDAAHDVQQTADGGYIIVGGCESYLAGGKLWLIKTDEYGDMQWNRIFEKVHYEGVYQTAPTSEGYSVQQTSDGGYIIAGAVMPGGRPTALWLIKTDPYGITTDEYGEYVPGAWEQVFHGEDEPLYGFASGASVQQIAGEGYIVAGERAEYGSDSDIWLIKTDLDGTVQWERTFDRTYTDPFSGEEYSGTEWSFSVRRTTDGGYVIAGVSLSFHDLYGWVIKTNSLGERTWDIVFEHYSHAAQQTTDGGYIVGGSAPISMWLAKTDDQGNQLWEKFIDYDQGTFGSDVLQADDGGYVIVGERRGAGGWKDAWLVKLAPEALPSNQPPTAVAGGPYTVPEGGLVNLNGSGSDPDDDPLIFAWDLDNDGTFETPGQNVIFSASGRDGPDSQAVALQVCDDKEACHTSDATVSIANEAPTANFNAPPDVDEGSYINLSLTDPFDPSSADASAGFTYAFDCGDGSGYGGFSSDNTAVCATIDDGTPTVKGKISDKDGGETEYAAQVTVNNAAPTATFSAPQYVIEGDDFELSLTDPLDPSSADTAYGFEYAFDCGDGGYGVWSSDDTATCTTNSGDAGTRAARGKMRDKDGGETEYTAAITVVPPSAVTDGSFCIFDREADLDGQQFRLIFTPDMQIWPAYKLPASNPGRFLYNVFYTGAGPASFTISLPERCETEGAMPVHVYTVVSVVDIDGFNCFVPDLESEIYAGDLSGLTGLYDPGGFFYVAVHLGYDLKGTTGYILGFDGDALDAETGEVLIPNLNDYTFSVSGSQSDSQTIRNVNAFKRIPGIGGLVTDGEGDPVEGATVVIYLDGDWLGEAATDEDGWYMFVYKHTSKPADYTVELQGYGLSKSGTLKASKFAEVNFVVE